MNTMKSWKQVIQSRRADEILIGAKVPWILGVGEIQVKIHYFVGRHIEFFTDDIDDSCIVLLINFTDQFLFLFFISAERLVHIAGNHWL